MKHYIEEIGEDPSVFSSHSMRSGDATDMAAMGASRSTLMRHGRWNSLLMPDLYVRMDDVDWQSHLRGLVPTRGSSMTPEPTRGRRRRIKTAHRSAKDRMK